MRRIILITTGGTIEKTYNELTGELVNRHSIVRRMLRRLRFEGTEVSILELMSKDSLQLSVEDRMRVVDVVRTFSGSNGSSSAPPMTADSGTTGVVILHGTDTLSDTGELIFQELQAPTIPVVLTGAIRPYEMKQSDALQNLNEAIFATRLLSPGVYCVAHGRVLTFPGVRKDRALGTFVQL